jgi:hypothetical protein
MAFLYIEEFDQMMVASHDALAVGRQPSIATQKIAIAVGSTPSATFNKRTRFVRLHADAICSYVFGDTQNNPAATTSNARLAAGATEYFGVEPGGDQLVANIQNT